MSKITIKSILKSKNEKTTFEGKGIKTKNKIIFKENEINTKITLEDKITIERTDEHYLKLVFNKHQKEEGKYQTKYGNLKIETYTKDIKKEDKKIKIYYDLIIEKHFIDTFEYIFEYSIDS